jgi:hypothetical protein
VAGTDPDEYLTVAATSTTVTFFPRLGLLTATAARELRGFG